MLREGKSRRGESLGQRAPTKHPRFPTTTRVSGSQAQNKKQNRKTRNAVTASRLEFLTGHPLGEVEPIGSGEGLLPVTNLQIQTRSRSSPLPPGGRGDHCNPHPSPGTGPNPSPRGEKVAAGRMRGRSGLRPHPSPLPPGGRAAFELFCPAGFGLSEPLPSGEVGRGSVRVRAGA